MITNKTKLDCVVNFRCSKKLRDIAKHWSDKVYPLQSGETGAKQSIARFFKNAAAEKLVSIGVSKQYIDSIL